MSNAAGDTGNDPTADGDLSILEKTTSGNLTQNSELDDYVITREIISTHL